MFGNAPILLLNLLAWARAFGAGVALRRCTAALRRLAGSGRPPSARLGTPADRAEDAAEEAATVRALADRYVRSDPAFAAELFAAAARHEQLHCAA